MGGVYVPRSPTTVRELTEQETDYALSAQLVSGQ